MQPKPLRQSILFTISYFDVFEYPLTYFELWKYLYCNSATLDQVILEVDKMVTENILESKNGFFFMPGKDYLYAKKQQKYDISEKFWNRAIFSAKILAFMPFIKGIFVVNSLALFNCDTDSDIDFLIIARKGRIWLTRAFSSIILHLFGIRRHGRKVAKRICLSFYVSESKLNLDYLAQDELGLYVAYWIAQSTPLINKGRIFEKFRAENNWIKDILPNCDLNYSNYYANFKYPLSSKIISKLLEIILWLNFFEKIARFIQLKKIKRSQRKWGNPQSVIVNDDILKFHPIDLRIEYKKKLDQNIEKLTINQ